METTKITFPNGTVRVYDRDGKLLSETRPNGQPVTLDDPEPSTNEWTLH